MSRIEPFFLEGSRGNIFAILFAPVDTAEVVIVVPPFAEEMNKSRRQITLTSQRLIAEGIATLVVDPFGTGDSEGEFEDARWEIWVEDILRSVDWACRSGFTKVHCLGVRLGALLAADAARHTVQKFCTTVLLQPVTDGSQFMNQFLRLRAAASMMGPGAGESVAEIVDRLRKQETQEVSGYCLSASLWQDIKSRKLADCLSRGLGRISMIEVQRGAGSAVSVRGRKLLEQAASKAFPVTPYIVSGEPFWSSAEIVINNRLVEKTALILSGSL